MVRVIYGNFFFVVFDEFNFNFDVIGEVVLINVIKVLCEKGFIVVVIVYCLNVIVIVDKILCLKDGKMVGFGFKEDVFK